MKQCIPAEGIIYPNDVERAIKKLSPSENELKGIKYLLPDKTSSCEDETTNKVLKAAASVSTSYLPSLINQSFNEV